MPHGLFEHSEKWNLKSMNLAEEICPITWWNSMSMMLENCSTNWRVKSIILQGYFHMRRVPTFLEEGQAWRKPTEPFLYLLEILSASIQ